MSLSHIAYVGTNACPFDRAAFGEFVRNAYRLHTSRGVTGAIAYSAFSVFHIIEGHTADVEAVFDQLQRDQHLSNTFLLLREQIVQRRFSRWCLGMTAVPMIFGFEQRVADERAIAELGWGSASRLLVALDRGWLSHGIRSAGAAVWSGPLAMASSGYDNGLLACELAPSSST